MSTTIHKPPIKRYSAYFSNCALRRETERIDKNERKQLIEKNKILNATISSSTSKAITPLSAFIETSTKKQNPSKLDDALRMWAFLSGICIDHCFYVARTLLELLRNANIWTYKIAIFLKSILSHQHFKCIRRHNVFKWCMYDELCEC